MSEIIFNKIKKDNIFVKDFHSFIKNNKIDFSEKNITVLYAPNGVGKTSLSKILGCEKNTSFEAVYNDKVFDENSNELFHIISDQNGRNIIQGDTEEFLLGDNIRKEFELKKEIDDTITEIKADGTYDEIYDKWFFSE